MSLKARVKICGITSLKDAYLATDLGAYAVGFVFYDGSKRYIPHEKAKQIAKELPPFVMRVGVFVNEAWDRIVEVKDYCMLDRVQIHADNRGLYEGVPGGVTIMAYGVRDKRDLDEAGKSAAFPLFDSDSGKGYGGSGMKFDWKLLEGFDRPFILAGGINVENIDDALTVRPYAVDICSGAEKSPGIKDPEKLREIFGRLE